MLDLAPLAIGVLLRSLPDMGSNPYVRNLVDLITSAFLEIGEGGKWDDYLQNPVRDPAIEQMLAVALRRNPSLAHDIDKAVRDVTDNSYKYTNQSHAQAGRDLVGGNVDNSSTHLGGPFAIGAVVVIAIVALVLVVGRVAYGYVTSGGLDAGSTCAEFLQASQDQELTAIRKIGVDEGVAGIGSPLALPAISYSCSAKPDARLGDVIAAFKGQF